VGVSGHTRKDNAGITGRSAARVLSVHQR
jgi:hypothetical protein